MTWPSKPSNMFALSGTVSALVTAQKISSPARQIVQGIDGSMRRRIDVGFLAR